MAIEQTQVPGFTAYPAPAGTTGPIRPIDTTTSTVRTTLIGSSFVVDIQISNAQDSTTPPHLYVPPDNSFETFRRVVATDFPTDIPQPVRYVRLVVVSGSVDNATIAQTSQRAATVSADQVQAAVDQRIGAALTPSTESVTVGGVVVTGTAYRPLISGSTPGSDTVTIGGVPISGNTVGGPTT